MKLITAIAALALLAGSMDVEAQKRKPDGPPGGGKKPRAHQKAPEGAETGHPHISPVGRLAIGVFGELDPEERKDLAEAAREGDEEALEELRAEHVEAIRAMIEVLDDEDARQMIGLGIMLAQISEIGQIDFSNDKGVKPFELEQHSLAEKGNTLAAGPPDLDMVQEQLEAQLQHWSAWGLDEHTD